MRRFRFRLAPLLRLRTQLERRARSDLAAAVAEVTAFDQRLAAAKQGLRDCADQAASSDAAGRLARALETGLRRHQWRLQQGQAEAQRRLDGARGEYVARTRDKRALEQLHDRRRDEWQTSVRRHEQMELDELARAGREALRRREAAGDQA